MFDYRIVDAKGYVTIMRARTRDVAINLFCQAEGCSRNYVKKHCVVRCVTQ